MDETTVLKPPRGAKRIEYHRGTSNYPPRTGMISRQKKRKIVSTPGQLWREIEAKRRREKRVEREREREKRTR